MTLDWMKQFGDQGQPYARTHEPLFHMHQGCPIATPPQLIVPHSKTSAGSGADWDCARVEFSFPAGALSATLRMESAGAITDSSCTDPAHDFANDGEFDGGGLALGEDFGRRGLQRVGIQRAKRRQGSGGDGKG